MRLLSIATAILVLSGLYALVFEREAVRAISKGAPLSVLFTGSIVEASTTPETDEGAQTSALEEETSQSDTNMPIKVKAIKSFAREVDSAVVLRGQTKAARQVEVRAETSGQVISDPLRKGTFVTEGQTLCQLDAGIRDSSLSDAVARLAEAEARVPETQARLHEAESRLEEARINFNAAKKLAEDGYATETRVAATEAAVSSAEAGVASAMAGFKATRSGIQSAEAAVAAAEKEIERLTLKTPFEGVLESDTAELGSLLQPGALCATVIQLDPIKVVGFVSETEMYRVKLGAPARAKLLAGQNVEGRVTFVSRSADSMTRTFRVDIEVDNKDLRISDGQTAAILIGAEGQVAHLIPQSALTLNDAGDLGVRLVDENSRAKFAPVTILRDTAEGLLLTGLAEKADIIVVGQEYVVDGVAVDAAYQKVTP